MKRYLLDTGPLAGALLGRRHVVDHLGERLDGDELATSVLAYGEIVEHIRGRQDFEARERELRDLLRDVCPYFLTYPILDRYAQVRRQMRPPSGPGLIGDIDTLVAATALERNLIVVTMDADFQRVPGLTVELVPRTR